MMKVLKYVFQSANQDINIIFIHINARYNVIAIHIGMDMYVSVALALREFIIPVFQYVERINKELMEYVNVKMVIDLSIITVFLFHVQMGKFGILHTKFVGHNVKLIKYGTDMPVFVLLAMKGIYTINVLLSVHLIKSM